MFLGDRIRGVLLYSFIVKIYTKNCIHIHTNQIQVDYLLHYFVTMWFFFYENFVYTPHSNTRTHRPFDVFDELYIFFGNHFMCKPNTRNPFLAYFLELNQTIENIFIFKKYFHLNKFCAWKTFYIEPKPVDPTTFST